MAVVVGATTTNLSFATRTNSDVLEPTGVGAGDGALVCYHVEGGVAVTKDGTGWTLIIEYGPHAGADYKTYIWYNANADAADFGITHASALTGATALEVSGHDTVTFLDPASPSSNEGTSLTATALSITTAFANTALVMVVNTFDSKSESGWTSPLLEVQDNSPFGTGAGVKASAGASGNKTADITAAGTDQWIAIMFGIKDATSSAVVPPPHPVIVNQAVSRAASW